jgi:hypothetical protein
MDAPITLVISDVIRDRPQEIIDLFIVKIILLLKIDLR